MTNLNGIALGNTQTSTFTDVGNMFKNIALAGIAVAIVYLIIKNNK